jgi:hypothetical protein
MTTPTNTPAPVPENVQAALDRLPTETLQAERQKALDAKLDIRGFDAALAKRQAAPIDAAKATDIERHGVNASPAREQYAKASLGRLTEGMSAEQVTGIRGATGEWASALQFSPATGNSIIERLASLGAELKSLEPGGRAEWADRAEQAALRSLAAKYPSELPAERQRLAGEDWKAMRAEAEKVLARAPNSDITKGLKDAPQMGDLWLVATLANHGRALGMVEKKYGDK